MKKIIPLFCTLTALLLLLASCGNNDPIDTNVTTDPITKESEALSSESVDEPAIKMEIEEGYTVMTSANFTIDVTEKGETVTLPGRVAILQDFENNRAIYFDVLEDDTIKVHVFLKGEGQLCLIQNKYLAIFICNVTAQTNPKVITLIGDFVEITDQPFPMGPDQRLEAVEIRRFPIDEIPDTTSVAILPAGIMQRNKAITFLEGYKDMCRSTENVYLLADSFTTPKDAPEAYDLTEQKALPDLDGQYYTVEYLEERYA